MPRVSDHNAIENGVAPRRPVVDAWDALARLLAHDDDLRQSDPVARPVRQDKDATP